MKNILKNLAFMLIGALVFSACDKEPDLPWGSFDDMEHLDDFYIYNIGLSDDELAGINDEDPEAYFNTITINHVRGQHQKLDLIVMYNNGTEWSGPFNVQEGITTLPASIVIDAEKLVQVIPDYTTIFDITLGQQYVFGLRITSKESVVFETLGIIDGALRRKLSANIRNYPGAAFETTVRAVRFCDYPMEEYVGNWTGTSGSHSETVVAELGTEYNTIKVYGLADFVTSSWGESWVEGDGSCLMTFSCGDVVTIERQWIGDSDYPDSYYIEGSGTLDPEAKTITLVYEVFYTGDSVDGLETVLSLGGTKSARMSFTPTR
jgi:hypothetical protein